MLEALLLVLDADFERPLYAEPEIDEIDEEWIARLVAIVDEVAEGDRRADGCDQYEEWHLGYKVLSRFGLAFCAVVTDDVPAAEVQTYLNNLAKQYTDEVDDIRDPDLDGLGDLIVDVIPPWEE
ncbi:MAG: hypothetical protein EP330_01030 [Deltaproteobacteria bacterium]|nr:MAG: hypothetical protein EP330_01030 [Deltaproteobacteria bacterium]